MACYSFSVVVLLGFLAGAAAVAAGAGSPATSGGCEASALAAELAASCVLAAAELGGAACLCAVASEMPVLHAGLNASALLALYAGCGGVRPLPACDVAVAGPMTSGGAAAVDVPVADDAATGLSESNDCAGVPEALVASCLGGRPTLPPPPPPHEIRHSRKERILVIGVGAILMFNVSVGLGFGVYKLYRRCCS